MNIYISMPAYVKGNYATLVNVTHLSLFAGTVKCQLNLIRKLKLCSWVQH